MSWKQPSGDEVLYVRPDAVFDKSKPISGGVPHCFPQFGPGKMQQHGFARNLDWAIASTSADLQVFASFTGFLLFALCVRVFVITTRPPSSLTHTHPKNK